MKMGFHGRAAIHKPKITMCKCQASAGVLDDDSVLRTLWQQFREDPFLFQHDNDPVHKVRSIQKWFLEISVEELDWSAQSPDLNPIEHLLRCNWNADCEPGLIAPTSVPDLTNALVAEWKQVPAAMFQHLVESLSQKSGGCYSSKEGTDSILILMILE
uniref:Tc1-like transposase DDE domain-containing protein n=1 Tax=Oncorhynchus tshawytscha TaxID=74940 RepID=A0AAZ3PX08_ONCTS